MESYPAKSFDDFAEVKEGGYNKFAGTEATGEAIVKRFIIDNRPSLVLTQKSLIKFQDVFYTVLTIQKEDNKEFKYIIEAKVKI